MLPLCIITTLRCICVVAAALTDRKGAGGVDDDHVCEGALTCHLALRRVDCADVRFALSAAPPSSSPNGGEEAGDEGC